MKRMPKEHEGIDFVFKIHSVASYKQKRGCEMEKKRDEFLCCLHR